MNDESIYPNSNVLINLPGIRDQAQLNKFERMATAARTLQLEKDPVQGDFDLGHLQKIHQHIFQDVYPFAGQIRNVDIHKENTSFCKSIFIKDMAGDIFDSLKRESHLKGLDIEHFSDRAAHYMAEINMLHPFREGNGRATREFMRNLSNNAGYELNFERVDRTQFVEAIKNTVHSSNQDLSNILRSCVSQQEQRISTDTVLLKDLLKSIDGMPNQAQATKLDKKQLNSEIVNFNVTKSGERNILRYQLKGEQQLQELQLSRVSYISKENKNLLIDQAAKGVKPIIRTWER